MHLAWAIQVNDLLLRHPLPAPNASVRACVVGVMAGTGDRHAKVQWTSVDSTETDLSPLSTLGNDSSDEDEDTLTIDDTVSIDETSSKQVRSSEEKGKHGIVSCCIIVVLLLLVLALVVTTLAVALVWLAARLPSPPSAATVGASSVGPAISCVDICRWPWQPTSPPSFAPTAADNREQVYAQYHQHELDEFVCPSNFRNLADYSLSFPLSAHRQYAFDETPYLTVPPFDSILPRCLAPAAIVYAQTHNCGNGQRPANPTDLPCEPQLPCPLLFHSSTSTLRTPIILLTGQSDTPTSYFCGLALDHANSSSHPLLLHWYGQNNDMADHPQLSGLPIGINCFDMARALRRVLTERWMLGRLGQCYGERRQRVVRGWATNATMTVVEEYMWRLDELRRASSAMDRTGVLQALLGLDQYVPSSAFEAALTNITRSWSGQMTAVNASSIRTLMAHRDADIATNRQPITSTHVPELACSLLAPTLAVSAPQLNTSIAAFFSSSSPAAFLTPTNVLNAQQTLQHGRGILAVANFGMTSPRRTAIWQALCEYPHSEANRDWLHCRPNFRELGDDLSFVYEQLLPPYLFWLSPQGNGYDSHRTWEALYMGAVPVMERLPITRHLFDDADLPVLLVDDMTKLTKATLLAHVPRFLNVSRDYSRRKLHIDYWKGVIVGKQRAYRAALRANSTTYVWDAMEGRRCWGAREP